MLERYEPNVRPSSRNRVASGRTCADGVRVTVDDDPVARLGHGLAGEYDFARVRHGRPPSRLTIARQRKPEKTADYIVSAHHVDEADQIRFTDVRCGGRSGGRRAEGVSTNVVAGHGVPDPAVPAAFKVVDTSRSPPVRRLYSRDTAGKRLLRQAAPERLPAPPGHDRGFGPDGSTPCG
jgi:hypothetical protein